jgi:hypothetical protein
MLKKLFEQVYATNVWQDSESVSGPGSNKNSPTIKDFQDTIMYVITNYVKDNKITIVDLPCGDCNFIFDILTFIINNTSVSHIEYYGYDIVEPLIDKLQNTIHSTDKLTIKFNTFNIVEGVIPIKVDIILCKELFIHLSFAHINAAIANINKSTFDFFIYGVNFNKINQDIAYSCPGECREVSLLIEPFNFNNFIYAHQNYLVYKSVVN